MKLAIAKAPTPAISNKPATKEPKGKRRSDKLIALMFIAQQMDGLFTISEMNDENFNLLADGRTLKPAHLETIRRHVRERVTVMRKAMDILLKKNDLL